MSNIVSSTQSSVSSIEKTFTSWDSCMSKAYCKWPVIAAIIVAAVVLLSILWCLFSCCCCGITLCGACLKCITCCGCCGACGDVGRRSGSRHKDAEYAQVPPQPQPYMGYQPTPMMGPGSFGQTATFDAPSKNARVHEDSLPHMPSWSNAVERRVEDTSPQETGTTGVGGRAAAEAAGAMEMSRMTPRTATGPGLTPPARSPYSQQNVGAGVVPGMSGAVRNPMRSPPIQQRRQYSSPYESDLGAQRMNDNAYDRPMPQHQNSYDYDQPVHNQGILSPAPTYHSHDPYHQQYPGENTAFLANQPRSPIRQETYPPQQSTHPYFGPDRGMQPQYQDPQPEYRSMTPSPPPQREPARQQSYSQSQAQPPREYTPFRVVSPPIEQNQNPVQRDYTPFRVVSPPTEPQQQGYGRGQGQGEIHEMSDRPPSFLQIGRKPVPASQRIL